MTALYSKEKKFTVQFLEKFNGNRLLPINNDPEKPFPVFKNVSNDNFVIGNK